MENFLEQKSSRVVKSTTQIQVQEIRKTCLKKFRAKLEYIVSFFMHDFHKKTQKLEPPPPPLRSSGFRWPENPPT